ncbi:MAG: Gmad2 immunoglobulin-like domain-containing protein [Bacteroidota bacterium]
MPEAPVADADLPAVEIDTPVQPEGEDLSDLIQLDAPQPNTTVSSPLKITGVARGTWFFEGDFPVALYADGGTIYAEGFATADGEWMTEDFVPFTAEITFSAPTGTEAKLELMRNNPSDDEGLDGALIVPVVIN